MKKLITLAMVLGLLVSGCAMGPRDNAISHRQQGDIKKNFLYVGIYRKAFLHEWGTPDATFIITSDEFGKFMGSSERMGSGRVVAFDCWVYKSRNTILVFNGLKLIGWKAIGEDDHKRWER